MRQAPVTHCVSRKSHITHADMSLINLCAEPPSCSPARTMIAERAKKGPARLDRTGQQAPAFSRASISFPPPSR